MSNADPDPRCPECGEPIGQTATYCMHCSADLSDEDTATESGDGVDGVGEPDEFARSQGADRADRVAGTTAEATGVVGRIVRQVAESVGSTSSSTDEATGELLDPDGLVDNTLTVLVGIAGGLVVGTVGTTVALILTGSGWAVLFGLIAWLGATAYLVRRRTVQGAISKSAYATAIVLLLVPAIALSPIVEVDGGMAERGGFFVVVLVFVAVPAAIAATIGWVAARFVPDEASGSEG